MSIDKTGTKGSVCHNKSGEITHRRAEIERFKRGRRIGDRDSSVSIQLVFK